MRLPLGGQIAVAYAQLASQATGKVSLPHVVHQLASGAATEHKESSPLVSFGSYRCRLQS